MNLLSWLLPLAVVFWVVVMFLAGCEERADFVCNCHPRKPHMASAKCSTLACFEKCAEVCK